MKKLLATLMFVVLLISCASFRQSSAIPVFDELRTIARKEGTLSGRDYAAIRKYEGELFCITLTGEKNWVAIQRFDAKTGFSYAVGCFPNSTVGEYIEGIFLGEELLDKRVISRSYAEEKAKKLLELFKKGRKLGVGET